MKKVTMFFEAQEYSYQEIIEFMVERLEKERETNIDSDTRALCRFIEGSIIHHRTLLNQLSKLHAKQLEELEIKESVETLFEDGNEDQGGNDE